VAGSRSVDSRLVRSDCSVVHLGAGSPRADLHLDWADSQADSRLADLCCSEACLSAGSR
jgi:hypothetical protein